MVAEFAANPDNATAWYTNIKSVQWETLAPVTVGSRFTFTARFLGRELKYTYEVAELIPQRRFVMRTAQGPFPMETVYTWEDGPDDSTLMTLANRGEPAGFSRIVRPFLAKAMERTNRNDLSRLKSILKSRP